MIEDSPLPETRPHIPVTLIAIDTSDKAKLTERAIGECEKRATFDSIKFLTHDEKLNRAVKIPAIQGLEGYSNFVIRELHKYVETSHCLIVQWDGYILNTNSWLPEYLQYDYIGAPWAGNVVGNGGFSLRSKKLLVKAASIAGSAHPEDNFICRVHRKELEGQGCKFAPAAIARQFSIEAATYSFEKNTWTSDGRGWNGQFGFHSFLTPLGTMPHRPRIFHHSGDIGDIIYSLAAMKVMGGGVLYLSPDCRFPYPRVPKICANMSNDTINPIIGFIRSQPYVWDVRYTRQMPFSTDVDFNAFREFYKIHRPENYMSLFRLHLLSCGVDYPENQPWLMCNESREIEGRPIIVNRTSRYHNTKFPWAAAIAQHGHKMAFVGLKPEYDAFCALNTAVTVPWIETPTLMDLAKVVNGAKVFIGNQSTPLAIALGLGKNAIAEIWIQNANVVLRRNNFICVKNGTFSIPREWL